MSTIAAAKFCAAVDDDMAPEYYEPDIRCTSLSAHRIGRSNHAAELLSLA
jgi:hypothetical protein